MAWWKPSYDVARTLPDERKAYLKSGGRWPPLSAHMIDIAPDIVRRTSRPGLYAAKRLRPKGHAPSRAYVAADAAFLERR